jgi:integrase
MTARHPTFIVSGGKGSSYFFRAVFPNDVKFLYNYPRELRISLQVGIQTEAKRLSAILKIQLDKIFNDIRSGNITETCVSSIKEQLRTHLNEVKTPINTNGYNGVKNSLRPPVIFSPNGTYQQKPMKLPSDYKLVREYVSKFRLEDIKAVVDHYDIDLKEDEVPGKKNLKPKEVNFPRKHVRQAREKLIKLIDEDMGLTWFANHLGEEILKLHLEPMEYDEFGKFLKDFNDADEEIQVLLEESDNLKPHALIEAIGEHYDLAEIALEIGVDKLFDTQHLDEEDAAEIDCNEDEDVDSAKQVWTALKSEPTKTEPAQSRQESVQASVEKNKPKSKPFLSEMVKEYFDEMVSVKAWGPKSALEIKTVLNRLVEITGNVPAEKLSHELARKYKKTLMKLPPNMSKDKRYRDLSIKEILKLEDVKPISINTVNNHLSFVIALMNYGKQHGFITENYFGGLKVTNTKKAQDERKPFSTKDLNRIFDSETFLKETEGYDFRYWIPLLALFTGGRLGELTQLHSSDIQKMQGIWCLNITKEGGTKENPKKLKNKSSDRIVPIHPQLIELGFMEFVNQQKKDREAVRLFPELTFNKADYFSRRCGRWFNAFYLRKKLGITDPSKTFHSFRHTVGNGLKQQGIAESFISELLGHSSGDTQSFTRYGKKYRPQLLLEEAVQKIEYKADFNDLKK